MPLPHIDGVEPPSWLTGVLLLGVTISAAGIADRLLTDAGYAILGAYVWTVSYGAMLFIIWLVWLRHIELTGPAEG